MPIASDNDRARTSLLVGLVMLLAHTTIAQGQELTLERMLRQPSITGTSPASPAWSPDGRYLAFLWNQTGMGRREIWVVTREGEQLRQQTPSEGGGIRQFVWMPNSKGFVCLRSGEIFRIDLESDESSQLTDTGGNKSNLDLSPDGHFVSFLQDGDLWLLELSSNVLTRATNVAIPSIAKIPLGRYNRPDVEIGPYVWGGPTYQWSPDSRHIAVHYVDRRQMPIVPFPYYLGEETEVNNLRRGYPGEPNELRTVGVYDVSNQALKLLDLPQPTSNRIVNFAWSNRGTLLIDQESDTTVDRWLHTYALREGDLRNVWHDKRESRIYTSIDSTWHPDGEHIVLLSDLEDRYGLYLLDPSTETIKRMTPAHYDVVSPPTIVGDQGIIFYHANDPNPYESHVFRLSETDDEATRISTLSGTNQGFPSPDGEKIALLHTDDLHPTELYLMDTVGVDDGGARQLQQITSSPPEEFQRYSWATARYATFPSRVDDYTLHARILEPTELDKSRKYPVIFGPVYSNTVRNRWAGMYGTLQQLLVQRGYIVVQVDVRGSTGYGRDFREEFLMDFAGDDLEDLHSAVDYLKTLPYVDADRIGIWGSSYGGTLTLYSLLKKPGLFKAGVAAAAAVDPYFFGTDDVAIVRRPETHPAAFTRGALQYAKNLQDHLLIIHGMQDDVVPFKTTVVLAEELMRQGKDFDFAFAPAATHGWTQQPHYARYLLNKLITHFDRYLRAE